MEKMNTMIKQIISFVVIISAMLAILEVISYLFGITGLVILLVLTFAVPLVIGCVACAGGKTP